MLKPLIIILCFAFLIGCDGNTSGKINKDKSAKKMADSINKRKVIDSQMALGERPDNEQGGQPFDEVKAGYLATYNKIKHIDTFVVLGNDSLHIHEKLYCLHDNSLVIPKKYLWGGDKSKDFITHNFVSNITIIKNSDTIINKIFKKGDFDSVINPEEKQYAILLNSNFMGYNKQYDGIIFSYSISIPLTDVGVPAYIVIDKKGNYRISNEYAKTN
ncbi:MAG TPA: DUF4738 domain-containing protein [Mucilaginibacter sp.]|jgi:hypothetical protein